MEACVHRSCTARLCTQWTARICHEAEFSPFGIDSVPFRSAEWDADMTRADKVRYWLQSPVRSADDLVQVTDHGGGCLVMRISVNIPTLDALQICLGPVVTPDNVHA
jgi:hypothetical protein